MRWRLSIRARLTIAFATAMILVLALAALFMYLRVSSELTSVVDEGLAARADDVSALVANSGGQAPSLRGTRFVEGEDGFSQILTADGRVVASTLPNRAAAVLDARELASARTRTRSLGERPVPGIAGDARILVRPAGQSVVVVGATTEDRTEALDGLRRAFLIGAPVALLIVSGLGYLLAGGALAPVAAMRRKASEITLERSGERLPLPRAEDEIHHLGETLNAMLDRIEASLQRERVFVADASHELRTPLANLRVEIELADRPERSEAEVRAALRSAGEEVDRLSQLTEDLLVIARSDQGQLPIVRQRVAVGMLLERVGERFTRRAQEAQREISISAPEGLEVNLDPLRIEQAVGNLIDNALRHGKGEIRVVATSHGGCLLLDVFDGGEGFGADFEADAFERFTRADAGRTGGGAGLGLAITRAIAEAHGGGVEIVVGDDPGTRVRLSLPL